MQYFTQAAFFDTSTITKMMVWTRHTFYGISENNNSRAKSQFINRFRLFLPSKWGGTNMHDLTLWQAALSLTLVYKLCHDTPNPNILGISSQPRPSTILLKSVLQHHATTLGITRDIRTFFWWPAAQYTQITTLLPLFWRKAFEAHLNTRPASAVLPQNSNAFDVLYFADTTNRPPDQHLGITVTQDGQDRIQPPDPLPDEWVTYISHPAYFLHIPTTNDPTVSGSLTRHYYQLAATYRIHNADLNTYSPAKERGNHLNPSLEALPFDKLQTATHFFTKYRYSDDIKDHAFKLFHRRMQPVYFDCPFCGLIPSRICPTPDLVKGTPAYTKRIFLHKTWQCQPLMRTWRRIAATLQITMPQSITSLALGVNPNLRDVDRTLRLSHLVLHATLWSHRFDIRMLHRRSLAQLPQTEKYIAALADDKAAIDARILTAYTAKLNAQQGTPRRGNPR